MGFDVGGNTARLEFLPGTVLDGATVRVSLDMSVRDFLALLRAATAPDTNDTSVVSERETELFTRFAETALLSWDLDRDGHAIPATAEGFLSLPYRHANAIYLAWFNALRTPPPNSHAASANGARSEADFEAMAPA